ncbi:MULTISPECIES: hypothetical protein [Coprobacillaceae]|uniref:hypothetical protein n=1 Tax=Coprobacillaceae TaxID=2810280 RepID=UPI000E4D0284|nr:MULTISPECIES: hypothetical protein [Coprobacillaceae]RHM63124.1 hypothetical protein DWZ53_01420 [Coprobacillus sp. AF33-1AC]RHS93227.1 hypothetical protein DW911_07160 [Erysipelatoclostridium sp. AM42-17]
MKLCLTSGNYHVFSLMIQNHQDSRIKIKNSYQLDYDLILEIDTTLKLEHVLSILKHELRYSPFMYLCPLFQLIPYHQRAKIGLQIPSLTSKNQLAFQ